MRLAFPNETTNFCWPKIATTIASATITTNTVCSACTTYMRIVVGSGWTKKIIGFWWPGQSPPADWNVYTRKSLLNSRCRRRRRVVGCSTARFRFSWNTFSTLLVICVVGLKLVVDWHRSSWLAWVECAVHTLLYIYGVMVSFLVKRRRHRHQFETARAPWLRSRAKSCNCLLS